MALLSQVLTAILFNPKEGQANPQSDLSCGEREALVSAWEFPSCSFAFYHFLPSSALISTSLL